MLHQGPASQFAHVGGLASSSPFAAQQEKLCAQALTQAQANACPPKSREIPEKLDTLEMRLNRLEIVSESLIARLRTVLASFPADAESGKVSAVGTQLGEVLQQYADRIERVEQSLTYAENAIQL